MKTFKFSPFWLLFALFFAQCSNPCGSDGTQLMEKFQHFASQNPDETRDRELRHFVQECYPMHKSKMSLLQKKDFWIGVLRYYYQRYGITMMAKLEDEKAMRDALIEGLKDVGMSFVSLTDLIMLL